MTPASKPAKMQITKTQDGRLHVAMGLGPKSKPAVLRPCTVIAWGIAETEPAPLPGQSYEQYLDVLYPPKEDTPMLTPAEDRNARELDQFAQAYEQMAAQPRNTLESAIASLILNDAFWSYPDDISTADAISRMREAIAQLE